jgi:hypothetical protein
VQGFALSESQLLIKFEKQLKLAYNVDFHEARCLIYNGNAERLALYNINPQVAASVAAEVSVKLPKKIKLP